MWGQPGEMGSHTGGMFSYSLDISREERVSKGVATVDTGPSLWRLLGLTCL